MRRTDTRKQSKEEKIIHRFKQIKIDCALQVVFPARGGVEVGWFYFKDFKL